MPENTALGSPILDNPFKTNEDQINAWKAEQARRQWAERLKAARVPARFRQASMNACAPEVQSWLATVVKGGNGWLVLAGENGVGKTYQACACVNQATRFMAAEFAVMNEIVIAVQSTYGGTGSADKLLRHYQRLPLLVIDEIEKFRANEWSAQLVFTLVNSRHSEQKPTIVTTNLSGEKLFSALAEGAGEVLASSLMSRLADKSNTHVVLTCDDRRLA